MGNALDAGEPDTRAFELPLAVQALEHAEQLVGVAGVEPRAVVANEEYRLVALAGDAAEDRRRQALDSFLL
jgi:hypothetical protein